MQYFIRPSAFLLRKIVSAFRAGRHLDVVRRRLVILWLVDIPAQRDIGQIGSVESQQVQVELLALQVDQFQSQQLLVLSGVQRQLVVGDDVGAFLGFGQVAMGIWGQAK